jgi:hypothetical protein
MSTPRMKSEGIAQILKVNGIPTLFPYGKLEITEKVIDFDDTVDFILPPEQL